MTALLTGREIEHAKRLAGMNRLSDDLAPARGIMVGILIGSALWLVIGIVIYCTFF